MTQVKIILLIGIILASFLQGCGVKKEQGTFLGFYKSEKKNDDIISMNIPSLIAKMFVKDNPEAKELLRKVRNMKLLMNESSSLKTKRFYKKLKKSLSPALYSELIEVKDGNETVEVEFLIRETEEEINELLMIVNDNGSCVAICIKGKIKHEKLLELTKLIDQEQIKEGY